MRRALLACAALLAASPAIAQQYSGYQPGPGPQPSTSGGGGGSGTVTSVGISLPSSLFTVTGSPVTTSGTLTGTLKTQLPNIVWAGPTMGAAAAPTFRALVGADLPTLTCSSISNAGTLCPASAGTGVVTALGVNVGSAGAVVVNGGAGGTPASLTLTNATGLPLSGLTGLGTGVATLLSGTASGTGGPAGTTSPSFTTPAIGAATGTSIALGGATIGSNALAVTGAASISGQTVTQAGNATTPGLSFQGDTGTGLADVSQGVSVVISGASAARFSGSGLRMISTAGIGWVTGTDPTQAFTTELLQDGSNTLAQRNGTNGQSFRVYNTFTDASNYERGQFAWSGGSLNIGTDASGTGAVHQVNFTIGGTAVWRISTSNHLLAVTDNAYDIGASGATRPRNGYFGTSVITPKEQYSTIYSAAGTALPTCNGGAEGTRAAVSDATSPTYLGAYTSGGTVHAPVYCNGTGWITD